MDAETYAKLDGVDILPKNELSECVVECIHVLSRPQALSVGLSEAENKP